MATYNQIQDYVKKKYGYLPKSCWIAHMKEIKGFPVKRAWNRKTDKRQVPCPEDRRPHIEDAFRHFGMLK